MKKVLFLFTLALSLSCSDDDSNSSASTSDFHPPTWIQGEWGLNGQAVIKFTTGDICAVTTGQEFCNQAIVNQSKATSTPAQVTEEVSETNYKATITIGSQNTVYNFQKVSATQIKWVNNNNQVLLKVN